eukprot:m.147267 g.147267  ORF g.147267 m.147267 type:complete len:405 (-) comp23138_c0_seq1:25-1239(-)
MADAGDAAVGRDGREEGGSVAVDTTPCPAHTPAGSLNHPSDSDPAVDEGEIVRLLQAQEAAVRREIDELKALIQSQALATKAALSEGDTLGAAVDDARQLLTDASKEVHDLTQQLNDAKNGRLTPRLYVLGGMEEQDHRLQTVECFDGKRWVLQQPRLNFTRSAPAAAEYNSGLYVVGGYDGKSDSNTVDRFDGESWVTVAPMLHRRSTCGAVAFQGALYVLGGCDGVDPNEVRHKAVERWNGVRWETVAPMREARSGVCCAVLGEHIYAIGGRDAHNSVLNSVERFDGTSWELVPNLLTQRVQAAAAVFQGKLYVIGGQGGQSEGARSLNVEAFDGTSWQRVPCDFGPPKKGVAAVAFDGALYIIGGHSGREYSSVVMRFNGKQWSKAPSLLSPRSVSAAVCF